MPSAQCNRNDQFSEVKPDCLRILLVDDDELYLQVIRRLLNRCHQYTYEVNIATSGEDAIKQCQTHKFDVLLIDYHLPRMSGLECLNSIRREETEQANMPPAILCTADGSEGTAGDALRADADDYLPKAQINVSSLARSIANVVTKHRLTCSIEQQFLELKRMNSQLEKKNREISNFYQTVSHEVKTPLSSVREFLSLVCDGVPGDVNTQQVELLEYALAGCDQLTRHFDDLVDITRLDLQKLPLVLAPCSIDGMLKISVGACAETLRQRNGKIHINNRVQGHSIIADQDRVIQVLSNLISNAIKYSNECPELHLHVDFDTDGDSILFTMEDSGCGISDEDANQIFDKLYQAGTANVDCLGAGLGLGLSIAKEIVTLHGGRIWMQSEIGVGSTFYFTLPLKQVEKLA